MTKILHLVIWQKKSSMIWRENTFVIWLKNFFVIWQEKHFVIAQENHVVLWREKTSGFLVRCYRSALFSDFPSQQKWQLQTCSAQRLTEDPPFISLGFALTYVLTFLLLCHRSALFLCHRSQLQRSAALESPLRPRLLRTSKASIPASASVPGDFWFAYM